jgi:hypothetical protein
MLHLEFLVSQYIQENPKLEKIPESRKCRLSSVGRAADLFIEIKGYYSPKDQEKIKQFPFSIRLLREKDLVDIFKYVVDMYGKDFIRLYESQCSSVGRAVAL